LALERAGRQERLHIRPINLSTGPVDGVVDAFGTSGAKGIGISGAAASGLRARGSQLTLWPETAIPSLNLESNKESNFLLERGDGGKPPRGRRSAR
jgi:hypothetical protein